MDESAQKIGQLPNANHGARSNREEEDLLNVAAVETILHGGMAFELPANKMLGGAAVTAVFRY